MKIMRSLLCLVLPLCLSGCGGLVADLNPQQAWGKLSLASYDYDVKRDCFCLPEYTRPMRVSVRNGAVSSAFYLDDSAAVPDKVLESLRTVDEWFAYIEKGREKPFFRLEVAYHGERGYPTYLHADVRERVADDEQTVRIENLSPR